MQDQIIPPSSASGNGAGGRIAAIQALRDQRPELGLRGAMEVVDGATTLDDARATVRPAPSVRLPGREPVQLRLRLTRPRVALDQAAEALRRETQALLVRYPLMALDRAALIARRRLRLPAPAEVVITVTMTR